MPHRSLYGDNRLPTTLIPPILTNLYDGGAGLVAFLHTRNKQVHTQDLMPSRSGQYCEILQLL